MRFKMGVGSFTGVAANIAEGGRVAIPLAIVAR